MNYKNMTKKSNRYIILCARKSRYISTGQAYYQLLINDNINQHNTVWLLDSNQIIKFLYTGLRIDKV